MNKIHFNVKDIMLDSSVLITGVLLFGGFIYINVYFWNFDINPILFFSVSDYISSSLDQVSIALLTGFITFVMVFILRFYQSNLTKKKVESEGIGSSGKIERVLNITVVFSSLAFIYIICQAYYKILWLNFNTLTVINAFRLWFIILLVTFIPRVCFKYFNNALTATFMLFFSFLFIVDVAINAMRHAYLVKTEVSRDLTFEVVIEGKEIIGKLMVTNNNYLFFYETETQSIVIYPNKNINYIKKKLEEK